MEWSPCLVDERVRAAIEWPAPPVYTGDLARDLIGTQLHDLATTRLAKDENTLRKSAVRSLDDCNAANLEAARKVRVWSWPWQ